MWLHGHAAVGQATAEVTVVRPLGDQIVLDVRPVGPAEDEGPFRAGLDREASLVQQVVVEEAQLEEVVEGGLAALRPVPDVMGLDEAPLVAAGKAATAVTAAKRPPDPGRDAPGLPSHTEGPPAFRKEHPEQARVAGDPPDGLGGHPRPLLQLGAPPLASGEGSGVDVDHNLVALASRAGGAPGGKRHLRHRHHGVGPARLTRIVGLAGRRFRGIVSASPPRLAQLVAGRLERLDQKRSLRGGKTEAQVKRAVLLVEVVAEKAVLMAPLRFLQPLSEAHPSVGPAQPLGLGGGGVPGD